MAQIDRRPRSAYFLSMTGIWTRPDILRRATALDIPAIMDIERQPGFELLVGRWTAEEHLRNISHHGYLYLVHDDEKGVPAAFAALTGMGDAKGEVLLNRMIVRTPGKGVGTFFLKAVMTAVFDGAPTQRLWLRVLPENERALRLYRRQGFMEERILEKAGMRPDGVRVDLLMMSISYEDWARKNGD